MRDEKSLFAKPEIAKTPEIPLWENESFPDAF
jgi:hypothetical protein